MIFKGQNYTLELDTETNISGADVCLIIYRKPSGAEGAFTGTVKEDTVVSCDITAEENDEAGYWLFQALVIMEGKSLYGKIITEEILNILNT